MPEALSRPKMPRTQRVGLVLFGVAIAMVALSYAAVPLYKAFCLATGYDGTVRRGGAPTEAALARKLTVRFDTNVRNLPWKFAPEEISQTVRIGEPSMAWFKIRNDGDQPITGRAIYNVVPESAAAYFIKTQCFCFTDQTIPAHTEMRFPVIYYVQPRFAQDRETRLFEEVTLSYTYFPSAAAGASASATPLQASKVQTAATKTREGLGGTAAGGL